MIATNVAIAALYLAIVAGLVQKYRRTNDQGFLWLGLPLVVMPLVVMPLLRFPLGHWLDRLASGRGVGFFPFTLVERGKNHWEFGCFVWISAAFGIVGILSHCDPDAKQNRLPSSFSKEGMTVQTG